MKKRLLITSIVMMLVVAVALSTATYAWFTSNGRVDATSMTLKASVSGEASLGIGWLGGNAGTSIESDLYDVLSPMAPATLSVNSTLSKNLLFKTSTIREEDSQFVFNGGSDSFVLTTDTEVDDEKTYYAVPEHGAYFEPVENPSDEDLDEYYEKVFSPIVYSKDGVQAFYVRNSSSANSISKVTVTASFTTTDTYILTKDTKFLAGSKYYTRSGSEDAYEYTLAEVTVGNDVTANTYYEKINGNDLIRVALFTKPQSSDTNTTADYKLLGVLGETATAFTAAGEIEAFDKNTTYYTRTGAGTENDPYVYSQVTTAFDDEATYYTAANTAVYGADSLYEDGDAVRDLSHYTKVSTSLTLVENLGTEKQVDIVAIAWLDGTLLDDDHASVLGQVSLHFTAA